nr:MAG TPA_asm: hypothetical protein [Caudoviricetes sp.]
MYISAVRVYNSKHDVGGSFSDIARYIASCQETEGFKCRVCKRDRQAGKRLRSCYMIVLPWAFERGGETVNAATVFIFGTGELARIMADELRARLSKDRFLVAYGVLV